MDDMIPAMLVGKTLGETVSRVLVSLLILVAIVMLGWGLISGKFWAWRADYWKDQAEGAAESAKTAAKNAENANAAAANATQTRAAIDNGTVTVRVESEESAGRIEAHVPNADPAAVEPDPDIVRELEAAQERARTAARRLQRADTR